MTRALEKHENWGGKIEVISRVSMDTQEQLSIAYTPGVAEPCLEISRDKELSYKYTRRHNLVAVITDGSAVLGLGNIGGLAGMPVMEGKCILFKKFGDVDAFPICINTQDTDQIVSTIANIADSFGGINLEDISAPRCFDIEKRLQEICDIPVFHDDQHGTAIVTAAALINALKVTNRTMHECKIVIIGTGAAGSAIAKLLLVMGYSDIIMCDRKGILYEGRDGMDKNKIELSLLTNKENISGGISDALKGRDVLIGVSGANTVSADMIRHMNVDPIVFALSNPIPEIMPDEAKNGGAKVIGTGRSDFPNQINNVLAFPGIFRGALDAKATCITDKMKQSAVYAIANLVDDSQLNAEYVIPNVFDKRVSVEVSKSVYEQAKAENICR